MPNAFLNEYFIESIQFLLAETFNVNGNIVYVDSLAINDISGLPLGIKLGYQATVLLFSSWKFLYGIKWYSYNFWLV